MGYFGIDCLIKELDEHVYYLEMMNDISYLEMMNVDTKSKFVISNRKRNISSNKKLSARFFETHPECTKFGSEWYRNPNIEEDFIEKLEKISFPSACYNKNLSDEFYERHINELSENDWWTLSYNPNVSEAFFEKHSNKLHWPSLCLNTSVSEAFFERYILQNKVNWGYLCQNKNISEEFFERYIGDSIAKYWGSLCCNENLSEAFFERYLQDLGMNVLSANKGMTEEFFERHIQDGKVNWCSLCKNTNMSEAFFDRHIDKFADDLYCWSSMCGNINISEEFFNRHERYKSKFDFYKLQLNNNISEEFIKNKLGRFFYDFEYDSSVHKVDLSDCKDKYITDRWMLLN